MSAKAGSASAERTAPNRFVFANWSWDEQTAGSTHSQHLAVVWPSDLHTAYAARNLAAQSRNVRAAREEPYQGLLELQRSYSDKLRESFDVSQMRIMFRYMAQRVVTFQNRLARLEKRERFYRNVVRRLTALEAAIGPRGRALEAIGVEWERLLPIMEEIAAELGWQASFSKPGEDGSVVIHSTSESSDHVAASTFDFFEALADRLEADVFEALSFEFDID